MQVTPKHAYTLDPTKSEWAGYAAVQAECGNLSGKELTRNSSGNTRSQSAQFAEPLWTDPGLKSGISLLELISTLKKKVQVGNKLSNIFPKSSHARTKPPPPETADRAAEEGLNKEPTDDLKSFSDLKPLSARYIDQVRQKEWDESVRVSNKLHEILPKLWTN